MWPLNAPAEDPKPEELEAIITHMEHMVNELDTMVTARDLEVVRSLRGKKPPKGSTYGAEIMKALYASAAEEENFCKHRVAGLAKKDSEDKHVEIENRAE